VGCVVTTNRGSVWVKVSISKRDKAFARVLYPKEPALSLKESSDELNPIKVTSDSVSHTKPHGPSDYLALAIATVGVGYLPLAPGTWGSLVGVVIYLLIRSLFYNSGQHIFFAVQLTVTVVVTLAGIWAATQTERISGRKDPGKVVVDEVAGQMISLMPVALVPFWTSWKIWVIVSFILFRFFDIVKPYPARQMERLHGGLGIMCDDLIAGGYGAAVILIATLVMSIM
jgi:phosphatidylglycerophosphatase A